MTDSTIGKVLGWYESPHTNERIEIRTIKDLKYVKYRLQRLRELYPMVFVK